MLDIKIVNGKIIDVENKSIIEGDIGIKNGKIKDIGIVEVEAKELVNTEGRHDKGNIIYW